MRLIRVGPAACPIHGSPISVLSRCMWPSTRPGSTRSPPISRVGTLFDREGAASPSVAMRPPATPISTRRPSASRQWVRSASSGMPFPSNQRSPATDMPPLRPSDLARYLDIEQRPVLLRPEDVGVAGAAARHSPVDRELDRQRRLARDMIADPRRLNAEELAHRVARQHSAL